MVKNEILIIENLDDDVIEDVRSKREGLFTNTFIIDGDSAYGYGDYGEIHTLDATSVLNAARFIWRKDEEGYIVTDDVLTPLGRPLHMEELILDIYGI